MTQHDPALIELLREQAKAGLTPSALLRLLATDHGIEQQIVWMELFSTAFECNLGSVTAIGAWWYEGKNELSDSDLDAYISYLVADYLERQP